MRPRCGPESFGLYSLPSALVPESGTEQNLSKCLLIEWVLCHLFPFLLLI